MACSLKFCRIVRPASRFLQSNFETNTPFYSSKKLFVTNIRGTKTYTVNPLTKQDRNSRKLSSTIPTSTEDNDSARKLSTVSTISTDQNINVRKLSTTSLEQDKNIQRLPTRSTEQDQHSRNLSTSWATNMSASDQVEAVVDDNMKSGEMKEVDIAGQGTALLIKEGSQYYAIGPKCSHYGAPLSKGVLCNGRVRCPWHGACFNIKSGDIEEFPGLDSIPTYKVEVADGKVKVRADKASLTNIKRQKQMCKSAAGNKNVVIIGGGPASVACAETLRQEGFQGSVTIVSKDKYIPYDRIKLSKAMDLSPEKIALRTNDFYKSYDITVSTDKEVTSVDTQAKTLKLADNSSMSYDSLLVATGGTPRILPIPGIDLENVFSLRTPDDANAIGKAAKDKNVVIIGSSFIGMEVASYLADKAKSLSVVDIIKVPFGLALGEQVGTVLQKMHEEKGVKFHFNASIKEFVGKDGKVSEAVLSTGDRIPADVAVMGVGVVPATSFLKESGIKMTDRGFIPVNEYMATETPDVYAAGDIVEFPLFTIGGKNANVQHWQMAHAHGRNAAYSIMGKKEPIRSVPYFWTVQYGKSVRYTGRNAAYSIMGKKQPIRSVPYFWTVQYGKSVRYTGYGPGYDDIKIHGSLDDQKFVAFYTKGDEVVAVASLNFDPIVSQVAEMFQAGKTIKKADIEKDPKSWVGQLSA